MSSSDPTPSFYSYSLTEMEGLNEIGDVVVPDNTIPGNPLGNQFLYLSVKTDCGQPLAPTLFAKDVIQGMISMQAHTVGQQLEVPLGVMLLSDTEAVVELSRRVNMDRTLAILAPLQYWLGQKVRLMCRAASPEEVENARRREEDEERASQPDTQDAKIIRMMEDIHKLAVSPHGDALRIPTFSGAIPPNKNEATFAQWIHEVREAQTRFPESTVRNWISRSLRGPPADAVRSLGPYASITSILNKLETMHGAVAPYDVMMRKLFGLSQSKGESVTNFAIRIETTLANIRRDHPHQMDRNQGEASQRDRFFQGLKKTYRDSLRYLYDTGAPYENILTAARKAEAEAEHYKEPETASAKAAQGVSPELMEELAAIKAVANKAWGSQQNQKKQGDPKRGGAGKFKDQQQKKGPGGPCYGCGGTGHFIRECPNPHKKSLNSKGGEPEEADSPCPEEGDRDFNGGSSIPRRRYHHTGWARTGLEPVVTICFRDAPFDALVDMSANYSMIDSKLCEYLHLDVTPFQYDVPYCMGIEGACMTKSIMAILGWVELQIGIPSLGLATIRLWVADTISSKGTPFILGSNQITKIFSQVNTEITNSWPQPWRSMHYRYVRGNHWCNEDAEDLYDSDAYDTEEEDSFDLLCQFESQLTPSTSHSSLESWLEQIDYPAPSEELASKEIVTKVAKKFQTRCLM